MKHEDLISFLRGSWKISREIIENENGKITRAEGKASFSMASDGLKYSDNVQLGSNIDSFQEYLYKIEDDQLIVCFKDTSLFYELGDDGYASYQCNEDNYGIEYVFYPESFTLTYYVSGPKKDYTMITKYKRQD